MKDKFIVEIFNTDGEVIKTERCKTLNEISSKYNIEYHQARTLLLNNDKTNYHEGIRELKKQINITRIKPEIKIE